MKIAVGPDDVGTGAGVPDGEVTRALAAFVAETPVAAVPSSAIVAARAAVVDTVGVALAGLEEPPSRIAATAALAAGAAGIAPLWGRQTGTAPAEAAWANAVAGHALDFDDSLPSLCGHPSVPLCATGLAVAAALSRRGRPVDGTAFLSAFVVALEVAGKLSRALGHGHYGRGWHPTATLGVFSATAMACRLQGLDATTTARAFGLAAAQSGGMVRNFGTMAKPFQAGHAARAAVISADLAAAGMTAAEDVFDGPRGYLAVYGNGSAAPMPVPGASWDIFEPGIYVKRWPCCYGNHRGLAGIFELVARHGIAADEVQRVEVGFLPDADKALIHRAPTDGLSAKFSIEYCAAAALIDGRVTLASFEDSAILRPDIRALMGGVHRVPMPGEGSFSGVLGWTDVAIDTARGRFETRVDHTPGSPEAPMTDADRLDKFMGCVTGLLGTDGADRLFAALGSLERMPDVAAIAPLMEVRA
ncbi:MmgE/PrpD family protein [Silicimonas algicola]|uniref:2-methylcitrate dehydratase PrpD n=1 Tax=Silicimonas algicola TaxID=1826607 RepID=A0A316G2F5_9RHOB|nr:MmgE/PrpD family protein [Silicimonas algicola]AZQ68288.1 MmgE/PrpD family protein [Silicimonas algicola]PWK54575.1 2-methylcitrate dehydratase PrpD [Silicimonas algicola]